MSEASEVMPGSCERFLIVRPGSSLLKVLAIFCPIFSSFVCFCTTLSVFSNYVVF